MAGDIGVFEQLLMPGTAGRKTFGAPGPILHVYGPRVQIGLGSPEDEAAIEAEAAAPLPPPEGLTDTERLGYEALMLRNSAEYRAGKSSRRRAAVSWGAEDGSAETLHLDPIDETMFASATNGNAPAAAAAPPRGTSDRLKGRVAVAIIMVSGPEPALELSPADQLKVVAEIQNGLGWLGSQSPSRDVTFVYETHHVTVDVADTTGGNSYEDFEAPWRNAAMAQLGIGAGLANVRTFVEALRNRLGTDWAYCTFFTRYRLRHFAYAGVGGPRLVMHFENDNWGVENIDRVFAHESCHIFGAPDEYAAANCTCGGSWGFFGRPNSNCITCAPGGGVKCIMRDNDWSMCDHTRAHLGF